VPLIVVDVEENLEWFVDCNEDVNEERLLRLSENLWRGEVGVLALVCCESSK
jgi:hypothetical protein